MKDKSKKSTYSTTFGVDPIRIAASGTRRGGDSNPRWAFDPHAISNRARSATPSPLLKIQRKLLSFAPPIEIHAREWI